MCCDQIGGRGAESGSLRQNWVREHATADRVAWSRRSPLTHRCTPHDTQQCNLIGRGPSLFFSGRSSTVCTPEPTAWPLVTGTYRKYPGCFTRTHTLSLSRQPCYHTVCACAREEASGFHNVPTLPDFVRDPRVYELVWIRPSENRVTF